MLKPSIISLIFCISFVSFGQKETDLDSQIEKFKTIIESNVHDSVKVNTLWEWDNLVYFTDPISDSIILEQIVDLSQKGLEATSNAEEKLFFGRNLATSLNYLGSALTGLGAYEDAITKHLEAIPIYKQLQQTEGLDGNYINLGIAYYDNGEIKNAIENYQLGLTATDKSGNLKYRANALLSLGNAYLDQGEILKSLEYYQEALHLNIDNDNRSGTANVYMNMANALMYNNQLDSAQTCYRLALNIEREIEDEYSLGTTLHNLGELYLKKSEMDSAFKYLSEGMKYREKYNQKSDLVYSYAGMGDWYRINGNSSLAVEWSEKAYNLSITMNSYVDMLPAVNSLYLAYEAANKFEKALEISKVLHNVQDSIKSSDNQKVLISREIEYEYEKNKIADSLAFEQKQALSDYTHQTELDQEAKERYFLYTGLGVVLVLGVFAYLGYRRKKADNIIISEQKATAELQKEQIEEAHQEITDSIAYAKRIQSAILPPAKMIQELLPNSFILYKPKDVVAGDFYWMERVDSKIFFAAADCTGHGVPGAMVSVICNGALNRSVREFELTDTGKILDKAREIVIQEFEKSEEDVKDGMDIALCSLENNKLQYSGANNALWIVRGDEIIETKADKQPIGKFEAAKAFTSHNIDVISGDLIYIFSDGFVDQFGGDKGKKFKAKALRSLILSIQNLSMYDQKEALDSSFDKWRGSLEQIDDVCMIGVRIP